MTSPNQMCDGNGGLWSCVCVRALSVWEKKRKGDGEGGEDEKTWGASFDAVNVQIYVEGQWSTFIRSSFFPPSLPAHASSHHISFFNTPPPHPLPPQAFSFLPLPSFSPTLSLTITSFSPPPCLSSVFRTLSLSPSFRLLWGDWDCCGLQQSDQ